MGSFDIAGKQVLITGGNTGIGKETAVQLAQRGAKVVFTSRSEERGREALAEVKERSGRDDPQVMPLDLASFASIRSFSDAYIQRFDRLHVLVNNAGVALQKRVVTADGFEAMFGINHLGHFLLTTLLLDTLKASAPARIVNLSSQGYMMAPDGLAWDDLQGESEFSWFPRYGHSKLANIYFTTELARRLEGTGVTVNSVHPGHVTTELGRDRPEDRVVDESPKPAKSSEQETSGIDLSQLPPPIDVEEGASTSVHVASSPDLEGVTGRYFDKCEAVDTTAVAADPAAAERLWKVSEELVAGVPA